MRRAAILTLALLAACSGRGEPGQDDLRTALTQSGNRGGAQAEKLACKSSPERPGYACDYRAPACNRFTGTCGAARPFTGRFLQAGGRWQLVEDLTPRAQPDPVTQPLPGVTIAPPAPTPTAAPVEPVVAADTSEPDVAAPIFEEPELEPRDQRRVSEWIGLDARCRAGGAFGRDSWDACEDRDRLARKLEDRGLCYGRDRIWRRCE